jgi:thiamine biosynthesis lipoprotein
MPGDVPAVFRFTHHAMATVFEVLVRGGEESYAGQAARTVFLEVDRIERLFSRFDPTSDVARLNRLGPGESMAVGVESYECLSLAEEVRRAVDGAFDINVRALIKYGGGAGTAPFELARTDVGFEVRRAAPERGRLTLLDLDLGGIGKGYALDRAVEFLADWSVEDALVHGGTSTAVAIGDAPGADGGGGKGWPVGVGAGWPCSGAPESFRLRGRALSGSGTEVKGRHILDPRTGLPAGGHLAAWASHPSAAVSDALSTAFMAMTTGEVEAYCRRHPEVWALVVRDYGDCRVFNPDVASDME